MLNHFGHIPTVWLFVVLVAAMGFAGFWAGRSKAEAIVARGQVARLNSRSNFHGYYVAMWTLAPVLVVAIAFGLFGDSLVQARLVSELPDGFAQLPANELAVYLERVRSFADSGVASGAENQLFSAVVARQAELNGTVKLGAIGLAAASALIGLFLARLRVSADFRARHGVERGLQAVLMLCAGEAIETTVGIVLSLITETLRFFGMVNPLSFLFGTHWNAQTNDEFGALPLFYGTFLISLIAMLVAVPVGLFSAIFLSEYASPRFRAWAKPILEVLAGIPTVVYGFFALLLVAPLVRMAAMGVNDLLMLLPFIDGPVLDAQPTSALAAGLVMGVMIIPFVSSLSDDVINAVPQSLRDGAYAVGATKSEAIKQVVLPAALPGVIAAIMLAVSRAIGETMIVVMAAGQRAQINPDPTSDITTITATIVALMTGDSEFDSPKTLSAFALGFVLFIVTLIFNLIAIRVVQRFREKYD